MALESIGIKDEESGLAYDFRDGVLDKMINEEGFDRDAGIGGLRVKNDKLEHKKKDGSWGGVGTKSRVMTVRLDFSNSDPSKWATYADDAVNMEVGSDEWDEFFGHYPCVMQNGVEKAKLSRNDFSNYENGSAFTPSIGEDAMIKFPRRGLKISKSGNIVTVSMTDAQNDPDFYYHAHTYKTNPVEAFYLGVYKGYESGSAIYSIRGYAPAASQTIGAFRTKCRARGTGYEQSGWFQLIFRQAMYMLKYQGQNAQNVIGRGYTTSTHTATINTGGSEAYGMDSEVIRKNNPSHMTDGEHHVKLFGLEDFYGNIWEWIDGLYSDGSRNFLVSDGNFNDSGSGYANAGASGFTADAVGWISNVAGNSLAGFAPIALSGSESTFLCDWGSVYASRLAKFGGAWNNASSAGVFQLSVNEAASAAYAYIGARLMFMGH